MNLSKYILTILLLWSVAAYTQSTRTDSVRSIKGENEFSLNFGFGVGLKLYTYTDCIYSDLGVACGSTKDTYWSNFVVIPSSFEAASRYNYAQHKKWRFGIMVNWVKIMGINDYLNLQPLHIGISNRLRINDKISYDFNLTGGAFVDFFMDYYTSGGSKKLKIQRRNIGLGVNPKFKVNIYQFCIGIEWQSLWGLQSNKPSIEHDVRYNLLSFVIGASF